MKQPLRNITISGSVFAALLLLWQYKAKGKILFLFSSPQHVWCSLVRNTINGILPYHTLITATEVLVGFFIGSIIGTTIGFLLWYSPLIHRIARPYILIIGIVPVFTVTPAIILWFGIGIKMKILLAALATGLLSLTHAYESASQIDLDEFRLLKIFGATRAQLLHIIVIPTSLSSVLSSLKLNISFAILGAFVGEFISSSEGLGYFMLRAGSLYNMADVFAGAIWLILFALMINVGIYYLQKYRQKIISVLSVKH